MSSMLMQRMQPFLNGVAACEAVVQEVLVDGLTEMVQRISVAEGIPEAQMLRHKEAVLARWKRHAQEPPKAKTCRAMTRLRKPCKKRARPLTDFCVHHERQREAHERDVVGRLQVAEHDAKVRAGRRRGHTHVWSYEQGFVADCAVCAECMPEGAAVSFSGQSIVSREGGEEVVSGVTPEPEDIGTSPH